MKAEALDVTLNRDRGIGGSDIPAIMGLSPFTTRFELLEYKVGNRTNDFKGNAYTEYGNELEPKIRDYINTLGYEFRPDYLEQEHKPLQWYYHADGYSEKDDMLLEIKTTSDIHSIDGYKKYLVQLLYGMALYDIEEGILAVYHRPDDFDPGFDKNRLQIFYIGTDDYTLLIKEIFDSIAEFESDYNAVIDNPWGFSEEDLPSLHCLKTVTQQHLMIGGMALPVTWLLQYGKDVDDSVKSIKSDLKDAMKEHNIKSAQFEDIGIKISYVPQGEDKIVKEFDADNFKKDHPELWEEYQKDVVKKGKADYVTARVAKRKDA